MTGYHEKLCGPNVHMALGFAVSVRGHIEVQELTLWIWKGSESTEGKKCGVWTCKSRKEGEEINEEKVPSLLWCMGPLTQHLPA